MTSPPPVQDERRDRSIRPLGSARRPGRSRTPTPSNPHPSLRSSGSGDRGAPSPSLSLRGEASSRARPTSRPLSASASASSPSSATLASQPTWATSHARPTQTQPERRPWFPYPSPSSTAAPTRPPTQPPSSAPSARRISTISLESSSSQSTHSTSSASSYNSEDITTRLGRRAMSAEPEEWSQAASRGRSSRMDRSGRRAKSRAKEGGEEQNAHQSSSSDDEKERAHFKSVLRAFDSYLSHSLAANNARRRSFYSLPRSHRLLLSSLGAPLPGPLLRSEGQEEGEDASLAVAGRGFKARLEEVDDRIRRNADVLAQIVDDSRGFLGEEESESSGEGKLAQEQGTETSKSTAAVATAEKENTSEGGQVEAGEAAATVARPDDGRTSSPPSLSSVRERPHRQRIQDHDLDKVRSTIKQFVRDWSQEGTLEREAAYDPILEALENAFKHVSSAHRNQLRVLVPGAGLGRLAFEIAWLGFSCQGNEFSFYMLLASHFILNKTVRIHQHVVYPFIHSSSNWRSANDMLRAIAIPDINPSDLPSHVDFSMVAGEFMEVYSKEQEKGAWNAVTTCFFIDTAHNLTRYLEVINHALVMGGLWINVGPLLWHYEGAANGDLSIELTLDEVLGLIELMGFHIESQRTLPPQPYTGNQSSMLSYQYSPEFWTARKIRDVAPAKIV